MARALPLVSTPEFGTGLPTGDWQALRGELVALLDQVEGQYAETGSADPAFAGFAQRMRDLRYQVADADPQDRHREALRSVKRQVDRFHDRGEPEATPQADTVLQSAIQQIRARTQAAAPHPMAAPMAAQPVAAAPRFDEFSQAVTGLAARLEQLEAELKVQRGNASQVREIADQVSQLSQVVELLAGAVGESGQVKRLESQIAGLAQLIGEGQKVDLGQLTDRLDQVSATVDRLADLQVQQIQHVVREAEATPQKEVEAARGLQAIEAGVRNIYDRIDTLESSVALPQDELERLGQMLGNITARLGADNARPDRLLGLVDALNGRINELEDRGEALAGLKGDIRGLREAVLGAIEPRFVAIEEKLDTLGAQLDRRDDNPTLTQLEAQIRQLVARMDQTGEQLSGLAALYAEDRTAAAPDFEALATLAATRTAETMARQAPPPAPLPDLNALADLVAARTADAMASQPQPELQMRPGQVDAIADIVAARADAAMTRRDGPVAPVLSDASLAEIEQRIGRLVDGFLKARAADAGAGVQQGIDRVEQRLGRLEQSLGNREVPSPAVLAVQPETVASAVTTEAAPQAIAPREVEPPAAAEPAATPTLHAAALDADAMPRNPATEAPLKEFGFPDLGPVRAALDARLSGRKPRAPVPDAEAEPSFETDPLTPEMAAPGSRPAASAARATPPATIAAPAFDPAQVVRPPRPESSLALNDDDAFSLPPSTLASPPREAVSASSRNTFIEAARRAAQRRAAPAETESLIGRALSRFHPETPAEPSAAVRPTPEPVPPLAPPPTSKAKAKAEAKAKAKAEAKSQAEAEAKSKTEAMPQAEPGKPVRRGLFSRQPKPVEPENSTPLLIPAAVKSPEPMTPTLVATAPAADLPDMLEERRAVLPESFLVRHRKPILVGASLIAVSFMTLNLVMQRLSSGEEASVAATPAAAAKQVTPAKTAPGATTPTPPSGAPVPAKPVSVIMPGAGHIVAATPPAAGPRITPATDPVVTASIGSGALNYAAEPAAAPMPPALAAANSAVANSTAGAVPPPVLDSPVKVELPPDAVGPLDLRQAAANGDARSQFEVAAIYSEGRAVPQDNKQAVAWYERAAAQGFAPAEYRLGNLYETGTGTAKDPEQARLWYQRAAEQGNRMAMHNLAALYAGGQFGKQDFVSAANWFQQAADRGMKDSQFNLGMLYARGLGVPQSLETSYKWFALAALTGDADAAKARDNIGRSLDAEAIKRVTAQVAAWKPAPIDLAANYAPIGTWEKNFNPGPAITTKDVVMKVQTALSRLGFDVGTPDGHVGAKTSVAIKAFERGTGMSEVGAINPRLLAVLGSQPV
jgi:localization factor PodJL